MFDTTINYVTDFNMCKDKGNFQYIKNKLPLPSDTVRSGYGKKLGYIQCIIRVFSQIAIKIIVTLTGKSLEMNNYRNFLQSVNTDDYKIELVGDFEEFVIDADLIA